MQLKVARYWILLEPESSHRSSDGALTSIVAIAGDELIVSELRTTGSSERSIAR